MICFAQHSYANTTNNRATFDTENVQECIKIMIDKGELQLTSGDRKDMVDKRRKEIGERERQRGLQRETERHKRETESHRETKRDREDTQMHRERESERQRDTRERLREAQERNREAQRDKQRQRRHTDTQRDRERHRERERQLDTARHKRGRTQSLGSKFQPN